VTADPLSAQVHSQAHAWGVLPKHLKAASIVGRAISELQQLKAQPNEGISTMLASESKRSGKNVRELEHELFLKLARLRSFSAFQNRKRWQPWSSTPAAILRVPRPARRCGSKAASARSSGEQQIGTHIGANHIIRSTAGSVSV